MRKNVEQYNAKKLARYHSTKVAVRQVQKCVAVTPAAKEMEQQALLREQAGHNRPVFIHHIIAAETMDEMVMERRNSKRTVQDILLDAMKKRGIA